MTERFTISEKFSNQSKRVIELALKKSKLPEGVSAVRWDEGATAEKPFVVIVQSPQ